MNMISFIAQWKQLDQKFILVQTDKALLEPQSKADSVLPEKPVILESQSMSQTIHRDKARTL